MFSSDIKGKMLEPIDDISDIKKKNEGSSPKDETTKIFLKNLSSETENNSNKNLSEPIKEKSNDTDNITSIFVDVTNSSKKISFISRDIHPSIYVSWKNNIMTKSMGGKATNLSLLENIKNIQIPKWFCISSEVFFDFLKNNNIFKKIEELDNLCKNFKDNEKQIEELTEQVQKEILSGTIDDKQEEDIVNALNLLKKQVKKENISVAVRSSALMEDLANASFAGLYDSFLNRKGKENILLAIKEVWASTFNARAIAERHRLDVAQTECLIAVIVQEMIHPQAAGVASSLELSTSYPGIEISANYGTGESVVGGEVSTDKWLVHQKKDYIIKSVIGDKNSCQFLSENETGTKQEILKEEMKKKLVLKNEMVLEIAKQVKIIRAYYNHEVDTEFAIDEKGTLYFVQARPLVDVTANEISVVHPEKAKDHTVIGSGVHSVPGVVHGVLKFIEKWEDLAQKTVKLNPGDIVVTYVSTNNWSHYLTNFGGLITKHGGPSSHPILLCRERKVPCLVGVDETFEKLKLYSGKEITLDGFNRVIYEGKVELKKASASDLLKAFDPVKVKELPSTESEIQALIKAKMVIEQDGKYWRKTPTYRVKQLQQEINMSRFTRATALIDNNKDCSVEGKVIDGYVCNFLGNFKDAVANFEGMDLEKCEQFSIKQEKNIKEYLKISTQFQLDPDQWDAYVSALIDLRTYIWIGGVFRAYVEAEVDRQASKLKIPQYYFEACSSVIQASIKEEDTRMQQDIHLLADEIKNEELPDDIMKLKVSNSDVFNKIKTLGQFYRFDKDISLEKELDLHLVYKKVLGAVKDIKDGKGFVTMKHTNDQEEFFPDHPTLKKWLTLSIKNRILQSNSHHYNVRGQWKVREELLRLGAHLTKLEILKNAEEVFDLSIKDIRKYIVQEKESLSL